MSSRQAVETVRAQALHLHKRLIDEARARHELIHGPVSPGALLQLVAFDPGFVWLRPLSQLILSLDERLEKAELTADDAVAARSELAHCFSRARTVPLAAA